MAHNPMKSPGSGVALVLGAALLATGAARAQNAPAAPAPVEALTPPTVSQESGAEHDWHPFSRNTMRIYMADVQTLEVEGDVARVRVAKIPLTGDAGDYSHTVEVVEFRCAAKQSRSTTEIQYGPDGAETDRYDDPTEWEGYRPESRDGYLAALVCGDERSSRNVPSIKAWVDAGRKSGD